jgi:hypothetical protein
MLIYVGKTFTSTATGVVVKDISCEQCGERFYYQLARVGTGRGTAPYYLGQNSAAARAQRAAEADLALKLRTECELVACPHCGHIQQQMIQVLRGRSYRSLIMWSWLLPAIGLFFTGLIAFFQRQSRPYRFWDDFTPYLVAATIFLAFLPLFLGLRKWLLSREKWLQRLLEVAPPALLPDGPPDINGNVPLRPAPRKEASADKADEWVTLPVLRMSLPPICCECLQPATTVYSTPFKANENSDSEVPLCENCLREINWRWWKTLGLTIITCLALASFIPILPIWSRKTDELGRWMLAGIFALFSTIIAAAMFPSWWTKPHQMRIVDAQRGIVRMRFRNPQYARLLRQMVCEIDGVQAK